MTDQDRIEADEDDGREPLPTLTEAEQEWCAEMREDALWDGGGDE